MAVVPPTPEALDAEAWLLVREARHALMSRLAAEAMADPGFVADLHETMQAFRHVDQEDWPAYDEE